MLSNRQASRAGAAVALVALVAGSSVALSSGSADAVTCKIKSHHRVSCPTAQLRGPAGPQGPQGPAGAPGAAGAAGAHGSLAVQPFKFLSVGASANTQFAQVNHAVFEASCTAVGQFAYARIRNNSLVDHNAETVQDLRTPGNWQHDGDFNGGDSWPLTPTGGAPLNAAFAAAPANGNQYALTYLGVNGDQLATALYSASASNNIGAARVGGQFDCAIYGTLQVGI